MWKRVLFLFLISGFSGSLLADWEADSHAAILKAVSSLPDEDLGDDTVALQVVQDDHTIYRHDKSERGGAPIFIRKGSDADKPVVILGEGEDFLPTCSEKKRAFVVLKQSGSDKKQYRILFAYLRASDGSVELESWTPRGQYFNRGNDFGFIRCGKSTLLPCKKEAQTASDDVPDYEDFGEKKGEVALPYQRSGKRKMESKGPTYWCDVVQDTELEKRFVGAMIDAVSQAVTVLSGAELVYKSEETVIQEMKGEIKKVATKVKAKGRSLGAVSPNTTEEAVKKLMNTGRSTVAGGVLVFYASVVKLGALGIGEIPPTDNIWDEDPKAEEKFVKYKSVGLRLMKNLFQGVDFEDPGQKLANPNPTRMLDENKVTALIEGREAGEDEKKAEGRGPLGWLFGGADVLTSTANGEQAIRQYGGVQKTGEVTGSKGIDNLNYAIDNAFGGTKKSAGQVFSENLMAGVYAPYGLIEDAADGLSGSVLGVGKVSTDRSYVDDIVDKAVSLVGGAAGQVVDVVGDILAPVGLGGLWTGVAGVAAAGLGGTGAVLAAPGLGINQLVKMGAKALGIGGVIGMYGEKSRGANDGGNQNFDRKTPAQAGYNSGGLQAPGAGYPPPAAYAPPGKRKKRASPAKTPDVYISTDVDLFSHLGWKTMDLSQDKLTTYKPSNDVAFLGFGNCDNKGTSWGDFKDVKSSKDAVHLYVQTMRTHCIQDQEEFIRDILKDGILKYKEEDKTFSVSPTSSLLKKSKLTKEDTAKLSKAFEFEAYSKVYAAQSQKEWKSGGDVLNSRAGNTFRVFAIQYMQEIAKQAPTHYVKLNRNLAKLVKTALTKALQDFYRFKYCKKCVKEQIEESLADTMLFSALLKFVVEGQEEEGYKDADKDAAFSKFYEENYLYVETNLAHYFH